MKKLSLDLRSLHAAYAKGLKPSELLRTVYDRIDQRGGDDKVWIYRVPEEDAIAAATRLEQRKAEGENLPLYGVPFAIKDNIDVAGLPTTAACPAFEYIAETTAFAVQRLLDAGAILIGKTNLDQFATGLVGTRTPYGSCSCVFDDRYISGGSSSGSTVAVAAGLVSFALGTDTAGSGRVPAGFNNIVGWKPTRGLLSTSGLLPACRSLDCISVFTLNCEDAQEIRQVVAVYDAEDPYSRRAPESDAVAAFPRQFRFGVPQASQLAFFGDTAAEALFSNALQRMKGLGGIAVEIDFAPFREVADLLYSGPWIAERYAAIEDFIKANPGALHPITESILSNAEKFNAVDTFRSLYRLQALQRQTESVWDGIDVMVLPTSGTIYTQEQVAESPVELNNNLGYYTNFVNLLDLCGVAVPAGFRTNGLPFGITLLAPAFHDAQVCELGGTFHRSQGGQFGNTGCCFTDLPHPPDKPVLRDIEVAVVGAHRLGLPLNNQLTSRCATLVRTVHTAPLYRLYELPETTPPKPGLVRTTGYCGPGIELEIWRMPAENFGSFVAEIPSPLCIGSILLDDGSTVKGFLCEAFATSGAEDITAYGSWPAYLSSPGAEAGDRKLQS